MKTQAKFFLLALAGLLSACSVENSVKEMSVTNQTASTTENALQAAYEQDNLRMIPYDHNMQGVVLTGDNHNRIMQTMNRAKLFLSDAEAVDLKTGKASNVEPLSWKKQDELVRSFLKQLDKDPYAFYYRQDCARNMIAYTDLLNDASDSALDALEFYVQIMSDEGTYSPGFFYYSLAKLKGKWSKGQIQEYVQKALSDRKKFDDKNRELASKFETNASEDGMSAGMLAYYQTMSKINDSYIQRLRTL